MEQSGSHLWCAVAAVSCAVTILIGATSPLEAQARIPAEDLLQPGGAFQLLENDAFLPQDDAEDAPHDLVGIIATREAEMDTSVEFSSRDVLGKDPKIFPAFEIALFTHDGDLVPVTRDVIRHGSTDKGRSFWDVIVQPGQVWSESEDGDWSRAAFPFALVHTIEGETHNGVATFVYNDAEVSDLRFQIVQQTAPYYVTEYFNAWGRIPTSYSPNEFEDLEDLREGYDMEVSDRLPVEEWQNLEAELGADVLEGFESEMDPDEIVASGMVRDGTLYLKPCRTEAGELPFCERQRFGLWSVGKAASSATALLRLAEKYGPEVYDARLGDYVEITAEHSGWNEVTFIDLLNMATGVGFGTAERDPNDSGDGYLEGNYEAWYVAPSRVEKVAASFDSPDLPWGPGEVVRYRDQDMFLLGVAMDAYLKQQEGPEADLWSMLVDEVFRPIGIHHAPTNRTIETEGGEPHPIMAFGYYPTLEDLAKIAQLYHQRGQHEGLQILDAGKIEELIYGTHERGLPSGTKLEDGEEHYHMAFWHRPYQSEGCRILVPMMRGWGGNLVVLMPDEITGIRLAKNWDGGEAVSDISGMLAVADRMVDFCE